MDSDLKKKVLEKEVLEKCPENESNDIHLCCYHYSCDFNFDTIGCQMTILLVHIICPTHTALITSTEEKRQRKLLDLKENKHLFL